MTIGRFIELITAEAELKESGKVAGKILELAKATLDEYTARRKYDELKVLRSAIATGAATQTLALPSSLQHIDRETVTFRESNDSELDEVLYWSNTFGINNDGQPSRVTRVGSNLVLWPYLDLTTADRIVIDYWARATFTFTSNSADFPVQILETVVKNKVIAKLLRSVDAKRAIMFEEDAKQSYQAVLAAAY